MKGISIFIFMENFKYSRDRPSFKPPQLAYIIIRGIKEIKRERGGGKRNREICKKRICVRVFVRNTRVQEEKSVILPAAFQTLLRDSYRVPINRARVILRPW